MSKMWMKRKSEKWIYERKTGMGVKIADVTTMVEEVIIQKV